MSNRAWTSTPPQVPSVPSEEKGREEVHKLRNAVAMYGDTIQQKKCPVCERQFTTNLNLYKHTTSKWTACVVEDQNWILALKNHIKLMKAIQEGKKKVSIFYEIDIDLL